MQMETFHLEGRVAIPYFNRWGELSYTTEQAFDHDPFQVLATSTSGSPVLFTSSLFVGFLKEAGGRFIYDGKGRLQVIYDDNQMLFIREGMEPYEAWDAYNHEVISLNGIEDRRRMPLYRTLEYCTWVEQKAQATEAANVHEVLSEAFMADYLNRLDKLQLPRGKVCLDDGWFDRHSATGSGTIFANERFPDLRRISHNIEAAGHIPGIWLDLGCVSPLSKFFQLNQHAVKPHSYFGGPAEQENKQSHTFYQPLPGKEMENHFRDVFDRLIDAGFVKFKLDMMYGNKREMSAILEAANRIAHELRADVEIEAHIPDIFVSRHCDVVRTNDVLIQADKPWRELTLAHWTTCLYSAPGRWLNLDHIGGNHPAVSEADFLKSLAMYDQIAGYPVLSLLPDRFSSDAQNEVRNLLARYEANVMNDSFFNKKLQFLG
ncbi:MAG: glycoside hydrolase [Paenibacillaceae bacterium]|nr:glycoside hydrolase [Paenibacillaceae bacterium]